MPSLLSLALLAALPTAQGADIDPFRAAASLPSGVGTLQGEAPMLGQDGFAGGVYANLAEDLAVFRRADGVRLPMFAHAFSTTVHGGFTWNQRARVDALVPIYAHVDAPWTGYRGAAVGDARLQATVPLPVGNEAFRLAFVSRVGVPTGSRNAWVGRGVHGGLTVAAGGELLDSRVGWVANAGATIAGPTDIEGVALGSTFDGVGGAWFVVDRTLRIGGELDLVATPGGAAGRSNVTSGAYLFAQAHLPEGFGLTAGAGRGVLDGIGSPGYRVFAAVHFGRVERRMPQIRMRPGVDTDGDGLPDAHDMCPVEVNVNADGFASADGCPVLDRDGDGVPDHLDLCPDVFGLPEHDGCPDSSGDGVPDHLDHCPDQEGLVEFHGCPDTDGDGIPDYRDACPDDPAHPDEDPALSDGCPKLAFLTVERQIGLAEPLGFIRGATLHPATGRVLDALADLLEAFPQIEQVEIGGHSDNRGAEAAAVRLTEEQAQAVLGQLVRRGVDEGRLVAKGYGPSQPIDTNRTEAGREANRRIELRILEKQPIVIEHPAPPGPRIDVVRAERRAEFAALAGLIEATPDDEAEGDPWMAVAGSLTVQLIGLDWADVWLDDRKLIRAAPFENLQVPPGAHVLRVVDPRTETTHELPVEIGSHQRLVVRLGADGLEQVAVGAREAPQGEDEAEGAEEGPAGDDEDIDPWGAQ